MVTAAILTVTYGGRVTLGQIVSAPTAQITIQYHKHVHDIISREGSNIYRKKLFATHSSKRIKI